MEQITDTDFKEKILDNKGLSAIDFWAEWCGPCKMYGPTFEAVSKETPDVTFAKMNIDENTEIPQKYNVRSIPTTIFFKDGEEVDRVAGMLGKEALVAKVKELQ